MSAHFGTWSVNEADGRRTPLLAAPATRALQPAREHFGKIGIGVDGSYHDLAVVERATSKGSIRYGCVILGSLSFERLTDRPGLG